MLKLFRRLQIYLIYRKRRDLLLIPVNIFGNSNFINFIYDSTTNCIVLVEVLTLDSLATHEITRFINELTERQCDYIVAGDFVKTIVETCEWLALFIHGYAHKEF